jgi:hypothetical protein
MTPEEFDAKFVDSPLHKSGLEILQRSAEICLQNAR